MKKSKLQGLTIAVLGLLIIFSSVAVVQLNASSRQEARLGGALGEVMLNWKLMVLNGPSFARDSGLEASLDSLENTLEEVDSPPSLVDRVPPLRAKLERAKAEDVWSFQFGFWNFAREDASVSLEGAEKGEDILVDKSNQEGSSSKSLGFRYLNFPNGEATAVVSVEERLRGPLTESFTLEFWMRADEKSRGSVVKSDNWALNLDDGRLALTDSLGNRILEAGEVPMEDWVHVSLTWDGKEAGLYLNGNEMKGRDVPGSLRISEQVTFGGGLVGDIDELRIKEKRLEREYLNYDRPVDYLIGFPVLNWVQASFGPEELWRFYAGLLISNISLKQKSEEYSVSSDNLSQVGGFLLGEGEKREIPSDLSEGFLEDIRKMKELGADGEISEDDAKELSRIIDSLSGYLQLN